MDFSLVVCVIFVWISVFDNATAYGPRNRGVGRRYGYDQQRENRRSKGRGYSYRSSDSSGRNSMRSSRSSSSGRAFIKKSRRGTKQPNIIYIMADDLGWNDVGFHNTLVRTPNIDRLAKNGIELTDYHASPTCSPSRSALLTGKYPSNTGMNQDVVLSQSKTCLPPELKLLPEIMKQNGYTTKMVGKWHLGYCNVSCLPTRRGFDEFRGIVDGLASYFTWGAFGVTTRFVNEKANIENRGKHLTLQHSSDIREMILSHEGAKSPLFMFISSLAPHDPLEVTPEMFNRHDFLDESIARENSRRRYLGLVAALDDIVGVTIRALKQANLYKNSVIVFTSDNGGASAQSLLPIQENHGNNYPLRGGKFELFEGAHRVPTVYYSPKLSRKTRGTKKDFLMHITDWLPTFAQMANPRYKTGDIDGVSQVSNLMNNKCSKRHDKYKAREEFLVYLTDFTQLRSNCSDSDAAYRWRDWKLIYGESAAFPLLRMNETGLWIRPAESPNLPELSGDLCAKTDSAGNTFVACLFNLRDDPSEQEDLYYKYPRLVKFLMSRIEKFRRSRAESVLQPSLGISPLTTTTINNVIVPRPGYCNPIIVSPLSPHNSLCDLT